MLMFMFVLFLIIFYIYLVRPWINTWGATAAEVNATLPGDNILPTAQVQSTRAITIHATPVDVWQWIVQVGQGRGGFFSYDWLENLFGLEIHTVDEIVPAYQTLAIGDEIRLGKDGPVYLVAELDPQRALVLRMPDQDTLQFSDPASSGNYDATWGFILRPVDARTTRLISRVTLASNTWSGRLINEIVVPISFIMEQKMLRGIKSRAESSVKSATA